MAATAPTLIGEMRGKRWAGEDERGNRRYRRVFEVQVASENYGARAVAAVLPVARGDPYSIGSMSDDFYETDPFSLCNSIQCQVSADDDMTWVCTVEYGAPDNEGFAAYEDPTEAPPKVTMTSEAVEVQLDFDADGNPILNTAGDWFQPSLTADRHYWILNVERYEPSFDPTAIVPYWDTKNDDTFFGFAAGLVAFKNAHLTGFEWNTQVGLLAKVAYEFWINPDGWTKTVLNAGTRQLVDGQLRDIQFEGVSAGTVWPLDEDGKAITDPDAERVTLDFEVLAEADYDGFGF